MRIPVTQKKHNLNAVNSSLQLWGVLLCLSVSAVVSVGIGVKYYHEFTVGTQRMVFVLFMILLGFVSFLLISIVISVWNSMALKNTFQKQAENDSIHRDTTHVGMGIIEDNVNHNDTLSRTEVEIDKQDIDPAYDVNNYQTIVNDSIQNQIKFQTTGSAQSVSQNVEDMNPEFIKKRLLEKETRIIEIVDVNVSENSDNMYDFSATIYVTAKSLMTAAEIVDSANYILEDEFNIKDTRLIPVIYQ